MEDLDHLPTNYYDWVRLDVQSNFALGLSMFRNEMLVSYALKGFCYFDLMRFLKTYCSTFTQCGNFKRFYVKLISRILEVQKSANLTYSEALNFGFYEFTSFLRQKFTESTKFRALTME